MPHCSSYRSHRKALSQQHDCLLGIRFRIRIFLAQHNDSSRPAVGRGGIRDWWRTEVPSGREGCSSTERFGTTIRYGLFKTRMAGRCHKLTSIFDPRARREVSRNSHSEYLPLPDSVVQENAMLKSLHTDQNAEFLAMLRQHRRQRRLRQSDFESPRQLRRLLRLREWSHEEVPEVFP